MDFEKRKEISIKRLDRAKQKKELYEIRAQAREIRRSMPRFRKPTATKILMAYIFGNCTVVEIYSMAAMWHIGDLSALYSLVTAVVGETISFAVYAAKSYHETKQEENVKLEREKLQIGQDTEPAREGAMG